MSPASYGDLFGQGSLNHENGANNMMINPDSVKASWQVHDAGLSEQLESLQQHKVFYPLHSGFLVVVDDFVPAQYHVLPGRKRMECIEFAYIHSGRARFTLRSGPGRGYRWDITSGVRTMLPYKTRPYDMEMVFEVDPAPVKMVTLYISPQRLSSLMGTELHALPVDLASGPSTFDGNEYDYCSTMGPAVESAVFQIFDCRLSDMVRKLFIEAKALELLSLELEHLCRRKTSATACRAEEIRGLHHARQIMMDNMLDPPTLTELAREVGLNVKKIKTGFRALFGATVYGFLHQYRMEKAMQLLRTDLSSVSEAAWAVGYVNVSHFSSAFRKQFGIRPGDYLRALRRSV
ncbi:MAG: Regulatory protein PchR [Syntrophorhabdaceae bacterium PtaU1.Bin034]|nr:MAG: Regulatory protein PchR [Syntrophorhabdaceae bacterium PtaU1.Bin034]